MYQSIAWFTLCTVCASINDPPPCQDSCEDTVSLRVSLGSSVLLPCSGQRGGWVLWVQPAGAPLVNLTAGGMVQFLEPRQGRLKAFPHEGRMGNFSIRIDAVQESDLGCYQCGPAHDACHQVEVRIQDAAFSLLPTLCIAGGLTALILSACTCCYCTCSQDNNSVLIHEENGEPEPEATGQSESAEEQDYLNVNPDPVPPATVHEYEQDWNHSVAPCTAVRDRHPRVARTRSAERKQALLQREITGRLQRVSPHFYVNQDEINKQTISTHRDRPGRASLWRKKATHSKRYENPIYNSS